MSECELWSHWRTHARDEATAAQLESLHEATAAAIADGGAVCWASGRCCHFNRFGHRLYVTGLEIAYMLERLTPAQRDLLASIDLTGPCPFQVGTLCSVHAVRPLGCRVFFCQHGAEAWQNELYERFMGGLRQLHDERRIPYRYMEWRAGLREAVDVQVESS